MACGCWNKEWDRWNTDDRPKCGQLPPDFEPDPKICDCRCHKLERDYLLEVREHWKCMDERREAMIKLYNMEQTHEPDTNGGPTSCSCKEPKLYDANCRRWLDKCPCTVQRIITCAICKGRKYPTE